MSGQKIIDYAELVFEVASRPCTCTRRVCAVSYIVPSLSLLLALFPVSLTLLFTASAAASVLFACRGLGSQVEDKR